MFPLVPKKKKNVYLDYAAATPLDTEVLKVMKPYFSDYFANSSSLYSLGIKSKNAHENARESIADILGTQSDTLCFTSGGTESNNLAIFGLVKKYFPLQKKKFHIITTKIEHDSVLRPIQELEKQGFDVTYLDVDEFGFVTASQVRNALQKNTILVSVMYANNEIGTLQPIADIGREILKWRKNNNTLFPYFHVDAAQAPNYLDLHVEKLHVDLMTLNGGKMYGPKGVGVLYKRRAVSLQAQNFGGRQEFGFRPGTENVAGIVGFAKALELVTKMQKVNNKKIEKLRNYFWTQIHKKISDVFVNGPACESEKRLVSNLNIYFKNVEAEALVLYLDSYGIFVSTGSACSTDSNEPSHVLKALKYSDERAEGSIRFTLGKDTSKQDIDYVMKYLPKIIEELRLIKKLCEKK